LIQVELGDLKKVGKEIAESLGRRLKTEVELKGKMIVVPDASGGAKIGVKDVKMQLKHVLHHLSLSEEYRVLSEEHRIRIVRIEEKVRRAQQKGTPPPASESLPYFFPG
jgi:hypothetical protein